MTTINEWLDEHAPLPAPIEPRHEAQGPAVCAGCGVTRINLAAGKYCSGCRRIIEQATGQVVR
jgi:hypothetical protein